jgi:hypothetical protein
MELDYELRRKEKALAEIIALAILGKISMPIEKKRGQLMSLTDRKNHAQ